MKTKFSSLATVVLISFFFCVSALGQTGSVSGYVFYHGDPDLPLEDIYVNIVTPGGVPMGSDVTDENGFYSFDDIPYGSYELEFETDIPSGGVTIQDAHRVIQFMQGVITFTPIQFEAADVTDDGQINFQDFFGIIFYCIFGQQFNSGEWVFENTTVTVGGVSRDGTSSSSGGSSGGDVDGSWLPGTRDVPVANVNYTDQIASSEEIEIPVRVDYSGKVAGFYIEMLKPSEFDIHDIQSDFAEITYSVSGDQIKVAWVNSETSYPELSEKALFTLKGKADQNSGEKLIVQLDPVSHVIDAKGKVIEQLDFSLPAITMAQNDKIINVLYPNPANDFAKISMQTSESGQLNIEIFDITGKSVKVIKTNTSEGYVNQVINVSELEPGMYLYRAHFKGETQNQSISNNLLIRR